MTVTDGRHLSVPILLDHIATGVTTRYPFPGEPDVDLLIEGSVPRLTLRATTEHAVRPPPDVLKSVSVAADYADGRHRLTVAISGRPLLLDGHAMLCAIADRIQLEHRDPLDAVSETLQRWRSVLAARTRLDVQAEIGLVGELLFLEALAVERPEPEALEAWRGSLGEEHDFGLVSTDVELKTTSGERREHWISGLGQLAPTGARPLVLVSLQITRGGSAGQTLPTLIDRLRHRFSDAPQFEAKLAAVRWSDEESDLFPERWRLRTAPRAFLIDATFPALTSASLAQTGLDLAAVRDVHYRLDLHDRPADAPSDQTLSSTITRLTAELP
jgi:hypothetical protein